MLHLPLDLLLNSFVDWSGLGFSLVGIFVGAGGPRSPGPGGGIAGGGGTILPGASITPPVLGLALGVDVYDPLAFASADFFADWSDYTSTSTVRIEEAVDLDSELNSAYAFEFTYSLFEPPRGEIQQVRQVGDGIGLDLGLSSPRTPRVYFGDTFVFNQVAQISTARDALGAVGAEQFRLFSISLSHGQDPSVPTSRLNDLYQFESPTARTYKAADMGMPAPLNDSGLRYTKYAAEGEKIEHTMLEMLEGEAKATGGYFVYIGDGVRLVSSLPSTTIDITSLLSSDPFASLTTFNPPRGYQGQSVELSENKKLVTDGATVTEPNETVTRFEFENAVDMADFNSPAGTGGETIVNGNELKEPGNCFDNGGRTKRARRIREVNGNPIEIGEVTKGLVFSSMVAYDFQTTISNGVALPTTKRIKPVIPSPALVAAWQTVESTLTRFFYDSEGYLTGSIKTGYKLMRYQRENKDEQAEVYKKLKDFSFAPLNPDTLRNRNKLVREFNSYSFSTAVSPTAVVSSLRVPDRYPINERTFYFLERFDDYYEDIDSTITPPPRFAATAYTSQSHQQFIANPKDDLASPPTDPNSPYPPLIIRKESKEFTSVQIQVPSFRGSNRKTPERFTTTTYGQNTEGEYGQDAIKIGSSTQSIGRPGVHTKKEVTAGAGGTVVPGVSPLAAMREFGKKKIVITAHNFGGIEDRSGSTPPLTSGSISYDGLIASDAELEQMVAGEIKKANLRLKEITKATLPLQHWNLVREGDGVTILEQDYVVMRKTIKGSRINAYEPYYQGSVELELAAGSEGEVSLTLYTV